MYISPTPIHKMSNWQAAEEGDIQDDFEFELEGTVNISFILKISVLFF